MLTPNAEARDRLKLRLREKIAEVWRRKRACGRRSLSSVRIRASWSISGHGTHLLAIHRRRGPGGDAREPPYLSGDNWGERVPTVHFVLDQDRLRLIGLTPSDAGEQLQSC